MKYLTPKKKAHELIMCFLKCDYTDINIEVAKQYSLIVCKNGKEYTNPCCESDAKKYWNLVEKEINIYEGKR